MKLNKDVVKGILECQLQKNGYCLEDLEKCLANNDSASLEKISSVLGKSGSWISDIWEPLRLTMATAMAGSMGLGALGGYGGYKAYRSYKDTNNMIDQKNQEKAKIMNANDELKQHLSQIQA